MTNIHIDDDNELDRDRLSCGTERQGYTIAIAVDGQQAVGTACELILMDMSLPVMNGWEVTRRIRATGSRVPIIALTARAMDGDEQKAKTAGCDDYDTKPVELPRLLGKMEALLKP